MSRAHRVLVRLAGAALTFAPAIAAAQLANASNAATALGGAYTVGAPAPLQAAAAVGFAFDADYYNHFTTDYKARRDFLGGVLRDIGFEFSVPEGAYYIFADFSKLSSDDDVTFAKWMAAEVGIATVPGSSFYSNKDDGRTFVRFAYCKKFETLKRAEKRLQGMAELLGKRDSGLGTRR